MTGDNRCEVCGDPVLYGSRCGTCAASWVPAASVTAERDDRLDTIRARDASVSDGWIEKWRAHTHDVYRAFVDRRDLLAEVDRLRAALADRDATLAEWNQTNDEDRQAALKQAERAEADLQVAYRLLADRDATLAAVQTAVNRHPKPCTDTEWSCGWKSAVVDTRAALAGDREPTP